VSSVCIPHITWISLNLAGRVACWRGNLSCETSPVLSNPCQVSAVPRMSKANSSPAYGPFPTSVVMFRHRAQLKEYPPPSCWTARTLESESRNLDPTRDQKKKGLLGSLFLREPSGSAFAKAQAQHKLSTKAKSTTSRVQDKRGTSIESNKSSLSASLASRLSISSASTSSKSSKT
jgi:hypothetical protein